MKRNIILISILSLGLTKTGWTQSDIESVYLKKVTNIEIELSASILKIEEHHLSEKAFYKNLNKHANESIHYSDFDPITDLEAQTLTPDKSSFKKTKVSTIETKDIVQSGIFYGGYKRKDFVYPNLSAGSIGHLEYTKSILDPHLLTPFYFEDNMGVRFAEFSVTFPKNVVIRHIIFGELKNKIEFKEQVLNNKIKYSWTLNEIPAFKSEKDSPNNTFSATHIIIFIDSYETKGKKIKVLSDVSDLYSWYSGLVKTIPAANDETLLKKTVNQLVRPGSTEVESIEAIFQWTQKNIKYIAFENGMAGFVPRSANDVFTKRYGDCKDMANLLKRMINMAGIDAYLTWIGTRSKQYTYSDVPTPIADNHMICSVKLKGEYVFLDATNSFLTFGKPSSMIQGKEALIGLNDHEYEVVKVPVLELLENQRIDSLQITIQPDGVHGNFSGYLNGYKKDDIEIQHLRAELNHDREYIRDFFDIGGDNISIESVVLQGLGEHNAPAYVHFKFFQPGYYKSIGDRIYINMNLNKTLPGEKIDIATREQLLEADYRFQDKSVTVFTIPPNYEVGVLPSDTEMKRPEFGISSKYTRKGNTIVLEKTFYSNYLYLDRTKFNDWNDLIKITSSINLQSITITKLK